MMMSTNSVNSGGTDSCNKDDVLSEITALCLGTGRFLRGVLVPFLVQANHRVALIQPRGTSMQEYLVQRQKQQTQKQQQQQHKQHDEMTYEVDTVQPDGSITTETVPIVACFSFGHVDDKKAFFQSSFPKMTKGYVIITAGC